MTDYLHVLLPLISGALFFMTGYYIKKNPPKDINGAVGYKTPASMKSQKHWDFAQQVSADKIKSASIFMMLTALPLYFFNQGSTINIIVAIVIVLFITILPIIQTESAINEKFGDS